MSLLLLLRPRAGDGGPPEPPAPTGSRLIRRARAAAVPRPDAEDEELIVLIQTYRRKTL